METNALHTLQTLEDKMVKLVPLSEEDKKELKSLLSLNKKQISEEIKLVKENVISKLSNKITESDDSELKEKVGNTIQKIQESESDLISLYKLKQLEQGL